MNANKFAVLAFFMAGVLSGVPAQAGESGTSAPALFGIHDIVLQYARLGDKDASASCGIIPGTLLSDFFRAMKSYGLPIQSLLEAKPPMVGVPRVDLVPEIYSVYDKGLNCVSWVSLTAQSQSAMPLAPVPTPRRVTVTYWRNGVLIGSPENFHAHEVSEALLRLGHQFADQYKTDQPPVLPGSGTP